MEYWPPSEEIIGFGVAGVKESRNQGVLDQAKGEQGWPSKSDSPG